VRFDDEMYTKRILADRTRFFAVNNAVNTYINYLTEQDVDSLYLLLDEEYKEDNKITKSNLLSKLDLLNDNMYIFQARRIFHEEQTEAIVKYYIFGHLRELLLDEHKDPVEYYLIIYIDNDNMTFSVRPYNGASFREE